MADRENMELLFFDTFSHENSDGINLDLVQFQKPVYVHEIRIIPLGTRVKADFPGGVRLGATNPSQFGLEFFVNDLSRTAVSTFEKLGSIDYKHNVDIQLRCSSKIPTDGMVIRGVYSTITLAVYGTLTRVARERSPPPPPPPPPQTPKAKVIKSPVTSPSGDFLKNQDVSEWTKEQSYDVQPKVIADSCMPQPSYSPSPSPKEQGGPIYAIESVQHLREKWSSDHSSPEASTHVKRELPPDRHESKTRSSREKMRTLERVSERERHRQWDQGRERDRGRDRDKDKSYSKSSTSSTRPPASSPKSRRPRTPPSPYPVDYEASDTAASTPPPIDQPTPSTPPPPPVTPSVPECENRDVAVTVTATEEEDRGLQEMFEPLTPEHSPSLQMDTLSDGEILDYYEEILSEEEDMSDSEDRIVDGELEYDLAEEAYATTFNPYSCEFTALTHFSSPALTIFELEMKVIAKGVVSEAEVTNQESQDLGASIANIVQQEEGPTDRWVEAAENVAPLLSQGLPKLLSRHQGSNAVEDLLSWCVLGLDFDVALSQPNPAFKVRHLKAGIALASALFNCNHHISDKMLELGLQSKLLNLYAKPYMALSLKLMILKALDASTNTKAGMLHFVREFEQTDDKQENGGIVQNVQSLEKDDETTRAAGVVEKHSCYEQLLDIVLSKQSSRAAVAAAALLRKVHTFELLQTLHSTVEKVVGGDSASCPLSDKDVETLSSCLSEVTYILTCASNTIAQPKRSLPAKAIFETIRPPHDPYPGLYSLFSDCNLLECLTVLLTCPHTFAVPAINSACRDLVSGFLVDLRGLVFLMANPELTTTLVRALLQPQDEAEENACHQLGLNLVNCLHALQCVDTLLSAQDPSVLKKEVDDAEVLASLHSLFTMSFTSVGRHAVVTVLEMEDNLAALLPFVQLAGDDDHDPKLRKSASHGYATELLLLTVRYSENVDMLLKFGDRLLAIGSQELTPRCQELGGWLTPLKKTKHLTAEAIPSLCAFIKSSLEEALSFPGELLTSLRALQRLSQPAPSFDRLRLDDRQEELKYKYVLVQLFASDVVATLMTLLQKLCDAYIYPSVHSPLLAGQQGALLVAVVKPSVLIIKRVLSYLIECRDAGFRDHRTTVPILLRLYASLGNIPVSSTYHSAVQKVKSDIVDTLLAFTQPSLGAAESEEVLSKAMWTQMLSEVLRFTLSAPMTFASGLSILSDLLPLPLPIQTREALTTEEITKAVNCRKLWSAHLHPLSQLVQDIVLAFLATSDLILQPLLRRVCIQLADLAAPTALVVVRALLDSISEALEKQKESVWTEDGARPPGSAYSSLLRQMAAVDHLVSHPVIKAAVLQLLRAGSKVDEKYSELLSNVTALVCDRGCPPQLQEYVLSILQSLCDVEISIIPTECDVPPLEQLACSLPTKEQMTVVCNALLSSLLTASSHSIPTLRTLFMMTEHDCGVHQLKMAFERHPDVMRDFLATLCVVPFGNPDWLHIVSTALEFLRALVIPYTMDGLSEADGASRTLALSSLELASAIKWSPLQKTVTPVDNPEEEAEVDEEEVANEDLHPLLRLEKILKSQSKDDDGIEIQALEHLSTILGILKENTSLASEKEMVEPVLPSPETLTSQFALRAVFVVGEIEEDRLSPSLWLAPPQAEDSDLDPEQVPCDLLALAERYCPGFDLKVDLDHACMVREAPDERHRKSASAVSVSSGLGKRKYQPLINPGSKELPRKRPFTPIRGRGFSRGMHSNRANDPFRSRPPNTSRPPSMHVDDFQAMETLQSPSSKRPSKETGRGRGRGSSFESGRGSFNSPRGRFFGTGTVSPYSRREERGGRNSGGGGRAVARTSGGGAGSATSGANLQWTLSRNQVLSGKASSKTNILPAVRSFSRGGHLETRPHRPSDPYSGCSVRYSRSPRATASSSAWPLSREKERPRFPGSSSRGRREVGTGRHSRAFTR